MKIALHYLFLFSTLFHHTHSSNNSSYYYNQCSQSTCGNSRLQFPFGKNPLCSSAYIKTHCEDNIVFLTDDENPSIKFKLLQNLTKEVYSNTSVRLIDTSLLGCGSIPPFTGLSPNAEKWLMLGAVHYTSDYRTGTLFNCTREPDSDNLLKLRKVPCLECGETSNLCYFYDGNLDHVDNCRAFRTAIPVKVFSNLTGVENLRSVLQRGFVIEWSRFCNSCMERDGGRCGYVNQEKKSGEEFCFCNNGIHKSNCVDGVVIDFDASGLDPLTKPHKNRVGLIVGIGVGATFLILSSSYIFHKRRPKLKPNCFSGEDEQALNSYLEGDNNTIPASIETFLHNYTLGRPTRFTYKQLKKYTNNFTNKIGQGGFGSVFKGQLPNGFTIAVKILDDTTDQSETQFLNEVLTIGKIHHNHLVRLLGFCFEQFRRALIYEFIVNGSLDKYIHQKKNTSSVQDPIEQLTLSWTQLYAIAIGTAKGIAYLHEECQSKILHCDIKPHNILLDDKFRPKVADFGLALAMNRDNSHITITHGAGTPGYAPPEMWFMKYGPVTEKSDVYSFGMVLLEMAGMRRNYEVDVSKSSEMYFPEWVFSHHVMNTNGRDDSGGGSKWHECVGKEEEEMAMKMELIGLWCIQFKPSKRPSMRKVVDMLEGNVVIDIPSAPFDATISAYGRRTDLLMAPQLEPLNSLEISESSESLQYHGQPEVGVDVDR